MAVVPFPSDVPPLRRARLARELRRYREQRGWSINEAGRHLGWNALKVGRQERGATKPAAGDIQRIAAVYELSDVERHRLLDLLATVDTHGWWRTYSDEIRGDTYISYEDEASSIRAWHRGFVPALTQTEAYVRSMLAHPLVHLTLEQVEQVVQIRMTRKLVLSRPIAPAYHAVIEEAALRRPTSTDHRVMANQMADLHQIATRDNVTVQIVPISATPVDVDEAFMLLDFTADPTIVVTDGLRHSLISPDPAAVELYTVAWSRITEAALTPEDSQTFLLDRQKEWST